MTIFIIPSWYPINKDDIGGSFFREQALAISDDNHKVVVLHGGFLGRKKYFRKENFRLTKYNDKGITVYSFLTPSFMLGRNIKAGLFIASHNIQKVYHAAVKEFGYPDIIHAHSYYPGGEVAIELGKKNNIPIIVTEHSSAVHTNQLSESRKKHLSTVVKECNDFICVSSSLKQQVETITGIDGKVKVVPNLVDNMFMYKKKQKNNDKAQFTFLSVGNLIQSKNHETIITAFCEAFSKEEKVKLKIVGAGTMEQGLKNQVISSGRKEQIIFTGRVGRDDVSVLMQNSNCFVLASKHETFGLVYVEALASGLPVITCDNGGSVDIINDKNGIILKENTKLAFSKAMREMYLNIDKYDLKKISDTCISKYGVDSFKKKMYRIYNECLNINFDK